MDVVTLQAAKAAAKKSGDASYSPLLAQRRRDLPGVVGLLTAYSGSAPTISVGAANAASAITSAQHLSPGGTSLTIVGANLVKSSTFDSATYGPSTLTPFNGNSFQIYRAGLLTDAPNLEFQYRGVGSAYRVWVDGQPLTLAPSNLPTGGALYRIAITFTGRALRRVEVETDTGHLAEVCVGPTDTVVPALARKGVRGLIMGDSYVEGTGATTRLTAWPQTFGQLCGWAETVASGSGGTGYLNPNTSGGSYVNRVKFRDRFTNDVASLTPDVVIFTGGRNDNGYGTVTQIQAEALALFQTAAAALPTAKFYVTSAFPASSAEAASSTLQAVSSAIATSAATVGFPFLDVMGANAYITGTGYVGATTGTGNADNLTSSDKVHPTQQGHDTLARVLFQRYAGALAA